MNLFVHAAIHHHPVHCGGTRTAFLSAPTNACVSVCACQVRQLAAVVARVPPLLPAHDDWEHEEHHHASPRRTLHRGRQGATPAGRAQSLHGRHAQRVRRGLLQVGRHHLQNDSWIGMSPTTSPRLRSEIKIFSDCGFSSICVRCNV